MKYSFIPTLFVSFLCGCSDNAPYTESFQQTSFTGNSYPTVFQTPAADNEVTYLAPGSRVLLNASGALQANNEVLTYRGEYWSADHALYGTDATDRTQVTALYPVYDNPTYTADQLYQHQLLEDVLYASNRYTEVPRVIHFQFEHLFARLAFQLDNELQTDLQEISLTTPASVSRIVPESAAVITDTEHPHTSTLLTSPDVERYSFIIPPAVEMAVSVRMQTRTKTYTTTLPLRSYNSGQAYTYYIKAADHRPGIATAADWIAFSRLINAKVPTSYKGKTLKDFGDTTDGVTTYRLLADIDFTDVDCNDLQHIGGQANFEERPFEDVFDGQGHTLSHLSAKAGYGTTGAFGAIGPNGVVKNLHMESCEAILDKDSPGSKTGVAILAGKNLGILSHCSVSGGKVDSSEQSSSTGGLTGVSSGSIINCYVKDTKVTSQRGDCGSLAGYSQGHIVNCFASGNTLTSPNGYCGGISGSSVPNASTQIHNCYVHKLKVQRYQGGIFIGKAQNSTVDHCFYSIDYPEFASELIQTGVNNTLRTGRITTDFTYKEQPLHQWLNQWVTQTAPDVYPDWAFLAWHNQGIDYPATFLP